jgi:hypothetical protein
MGKLAALAVGYVIGARSGGKDLDQLLGSLRALRETEEFADVVSAVRSQVGHTLRGLATMVDGAPTERRAQHEPADLVDRVRSIFGGV